jgi:YbgC/YbaW family acyl-CoA thioester hydrolase
MAYEFTTTKKIEFSETDMAGLVHFSNYFRYMEVAERDFFDSLGLNLIQSAPNDLVGYPRTRAECKFSAPLRFGDTVKIHLAIKAIKDRSIDYQFRLFKLDRKGEESAVAKGHITTIYTELTEDGNLQSRPLPQALLDKIEEAPTEVLRPGQV